MTPRFFRPALGILAASLVLSGCNRDLLPRCPGSAILGDAARRMVLKPGSAAADPAATLFTVAMTGIESDCQTNVRQGRTSADVAITFRATRAPNGQAARYSVPYFVAVNQAERVLNKRVYTATVNFAPGATSVAFNVSLDANVLVLENGHQPTDYQFLAGLQISDAEHAYMKTMGRYAP